MEIFKPKEPGPETRRSAERAGEGDRRRGGWRDFRRAYPGFVFVLGLGLVAMIAVDGWLFAKRVKYNHDVAQLRAHMTQAERERTDAIVQSEQNKLRIAIELAKRQAKFDKRLHLNVSIDSSRMYLTREGALLREMPVQFGPENRPRLRRPLSRAASARLLICPTPELRSMEARRFCRPLRQTSRATPAEFRPVRCE